MKWKKKARLVHSRRAFSIRRFLARSLQGDFDCVGRNAQCG